jgi:hypothetical protein
MKNARSSLQRLDCSPAVRALAQGIGIAFLGHKTILRDVL